MQNLTSQPFNLKESILPPSGKEPIPLGSGVITRNLGSGGMASVYEIWDQQLEVYRAVKLMHPNCSAEALSRFQTEIKITAKMHHPNIVEIHGVGTWNNLPYIEMEKAEGITLEALINCRGALPVDVCISIGILTTRALDYAHNHNYMLYNKEYNGVIHRDLKPGNIMISSHEHVKLMDFGIARPADASFHTIDGTVVGTLQYLSPEQLEGCQLDIRTDIYSLGTCLYEAVCGNYAFPESNIQRLIADKSKNHFRPLNDYSAKFPDMFIKIIHRCMHHDRNVRPQNALQLCSDLEQLLEKITADKPELIISKYMESQIGQKVEVVPIRRISARVLSFMLLVMAAGIIVVSLLLIIGSNKKMTSQVVQPEKPVISDTIRQMILRVENEVKVKEKIEQPAVIAKNQNTPSAKKVGETTTSIPESKSIFKPLYTKYSTHDLLEIMKSELATGDAWLVLAAYDSLPMSVAAGSEALVVKMRALKKVNRKMLSSFLHGITATEGEVLLEKAWLAYDAGEIPESENFLDKALGAPRALISYELLVKEVFYLKALTATKKFDAAPDDKNWKAALEAWYNVKKEMRSQPTHSYYVAADREVTRIGEKYRSKAR